MQLILTKKERLMLLLELRLERYRRYADRIRVVLLLDEGRSAKSISEYLFMNEKTVRHYCNSYNRGGLEELIHDDYKGKEFRLNEVQRANLVSHLSTYLYRTTEEVRGYIYNLNSV